MPSTHVLRAAQRFRTERSGIVTTHEFSFGDHYDPARTSYGALVAHNRETLQPGTGYAPHLHRDVEIVTWVVTGTLQHDDDHGHSGLLGPGTVQRLTAAAGVTHSEVNADRAPDGHVAQFVQLWLSLPADELQEGEAPSYERATPPLGPGSGWVALAASPGAALTESAVSLRSPGVALRAAELIDGERRQLPHASLLHLYVVSGALSLSSGEILEPGDSATVDDCDGGEVDGVPDAQVLVLTMEPEGADPGR